MVQESRIDYNPTEHTEFIHRESERVIKSYNIFRHADPKGKRVVDVGCGDGVLARKAVDLGAAFTLGIDNDPGMIELARKASGGQPNIQYELAAAEDYPGREDFDIAICSYLFNNASTYEGLAAQARGVGSMLRRGGVAIIYNSNPFDTKGGEATEMGWQKVVHGTESGSLIEFICEGMRKPIKNYYLSPEAHEKAFAEAGFESFEWKPLKLPPGIKDSAYPLINSQEPFHIIAAIARK